MALIFADGFDGWNSTAQVSGLYSGIGTVVAGQSGRIGGYSLQLNHQNSGYINVALASKQTVIMGMAVRFTSSYSGSTGAQGIFSLYDGASRQVDVRINTSGILYITRNGTTIATDTVTRIPVGIWTYIEWKVYIHDSAGTSEIRINGSSSDAWAVTGLDTKNTANAYATVCGPGCMFNPAGQYHIDDFYVCDTSGPVNNDSLGDIRIVPFSPAGAGNSTQMTPSAGSNYQCVDEDSYGAGDDGDTSYVESNTSGHLDLYTVADLASRSVAGAIKAVILGAVARKTDAGARELRLVVRSGGSNYESASRSLSTAYQNFVHILETDPATSAAWTGTGFDAIEIGPKVQT